MPALLRCRFCHLFAALVWAAGAQGLLAQTPDTPFTERPLAETSDRNFTPLGQAALGIRSADWKHAETANFIYHYFQSFVAAPVSVEAEFYYRVIARELEKDTTQWERKSHIFVFETAEDWAAFQKRGALDPWTGGIHSRGELFLRRDPQFRFKGNTLGHEVAHLVVDRFFGSNVPLWLNEGYAEYVSIRGYAAFQRARNYRMRPTSVAVANAQFIPLAELTAALSYPQDVLRVEAFYSESERLTRFLSAANKSGFGVFFEALAKGARFETALSRGFAGRFPSLEALEREFRKYATNESGAPPQD
ncbi:MAG: hypothetical protein JWQ44_1645 [Chthoniobacter sp.]|jgi:hypothetical protein|nr:hypothetical protein [Chthoniobacter sp.]